MGSKERRPRQMGLNIGSASIIMLFAVLSLTVLAALSLLSANSQYALAQRSADAVSDYYAADYEAARIYERVAAGDYSDVEAYEETGAAYYRYSVEISSRSALEVVLAEGGDRPAIISWRVTETDEWIPDESLDLWGGADNE
jgi:hypothetical protein